MKAVISKTRNNEKAFAVMLCEAPEFPDAQPWKPIDVQRLIVIAANDDSGAWGWVDLDKDEKDCIGQALLNYDAGLNGWYWCTLYKGQPNQQGFQREKRYIVLKIKDIDFALNGAQKASLMMYCEQVEGGRTDIGKPPLECVVVESDWPEFEPTWKAIEQRMNASQQ